MKDKSQLKTKGCSLKLTQEDYNSMKKILSVRKLQFNTVVNGLIKQYIAENRHLVEIWDNAFGKE